MLIPAVIPNSGKPELKIEDWRLNICCILSILFRLHRQKSKIQIMDTQPGEAETKILRNDESMLP
jgi:hypothetical protein